MHETYRKPELFALVNDQSWQFLPGFVFKASGFLHFLHFVTCKMSEIGKKRAK